MQRFAQLFEELDRSTATLDKLAALQRYFAQAPARDAAWALHLLRGEKMTARGQKLASSTELRAWLADVAQLPPWLVDASYDQVGDLAETLALLLDEPAQQAPDISLSDWIEKKLLPHANADEAERRAAVVGGWQCLPFAQRLVFNKLLTGALRVGVSQALVQRALAQTSGIDVARIAQRMLGSWQPSEEAMVQLLDTQELASDRAQPYPFYLASPLESEPASLGSIDDWLLEWKWDGIRLQLLVRGGEVALWSRGEERLDGRFPEIEAAATGLPEGCVIDGELLAWLPGESTPMNFTALQTRIQRRKPSPKTLELTPARLMAYDLLEWQGEDLRNQPLSMRRAALQELLQTLNHPLITCSPLLQASSWEHAAEQRQLVRGLGVEGLMLKRRNSPYQTGRKRGDWWKWKIEPLTIDAVLIYAQAGHGRRSTLHTDYTFALWDDLTPADDAIDSEATRTDPEGATGSSGLKLVPVAKAYSGLSDAELIELDRWIRSHTQERFGPVRSVAPLLVFEIAFEAVNQSQRHKSGIAVRFPRILRWRRDKPAAQANRLSELKSLAR